MDPRLSRGVLNGDSVVICTRKMPTSNEKASPPIQITWETVSWVHAT